MFSSFKFYHELGPETWLALNINLEAPVRLHFKTAVAIVDSNLLPHSLTRPTGNDRMAVFGPATGSQGRQMKF